MFELRMATTSDAAVEPQRFPSSRAYNGARPSSASHWPFRAAGRWAPIRPASIRPLPKPIFTRIGSRASRSAPSMPRSSRATRRRLGSQSFGTSGRGSPSADEWLGHSVLVPSGGATADNRPGEPAVQRRSHAIMLSHSPGGFGCVVASPDSSYLAPCHRGFARRFNGGDQLLRHAPLKETLERLIDFDRINEGAMRFSVGAVNVRTGNFVCFDTTTHRIGPEHVMASGALAARLSRRRDRRRALLGWRPCLEHAAGMDGRKRAAAGHPGFPGRSLERARRFSSRHGRSRDAAEGDPVFEPNPRRHRAASSACRVDAPVGSKLEAAARTGATARRWRCCSR